MIRFLALALALVATASAQAPPDALTGAWHVDRVTYAEPDTSGSLLPEAPFLAVTAARFEPGGALVVTMTVPDREGYSARDVPATYRLNGDHLTVDLDEAGEGGFAFGFTVATGDGMLVLSNETGTLRLRRAGG